ncbi:hypothetical protein D3C76_1707780 [compost metagenome]
MPERLEAFLASQPEELLALATQLIEQLATSPHRVLEVSRASHCQHRHIHLGKPRPPVTVLVTKTAKQAVPTHAFQRQPYRFVLRPALETRPGNLPPTLE